MPKSREWKLNHLRRALGHETLTKSTEVVFFCLKHGSKAGRSVGQLSVNVEYDWFNCWSCGFAGKSLFPLIRLSDPQAAREYLDEHAGHVKKRPEKQYERPTLPRDFRALSSASRSPYHNCAMKYLRGRGLTDDDVLLYRLGYAEDGPYKNRIIVPSFDLFGELNFVTSRYIYDDIPSQGRYKNGGNYDKDIIFNEYLIDWSEPVILVEGPFDSMIAGTNAIPLQGVRLNEDSVLFQRIVLENPQVYIALDVDAFKKQLMIVQNFLDYGISPQIVNFSGKKDPAEMGKKFFEESLTSARKVHDQWDITKIRIGA